MSRAFPVVAALAVVVAGAAAGAIAWRRSSSSDLPQVDSPPPSPEVLARTTPDLDLPISAEAERDAAPVAVSVLITRKQLLIGGDPEPLAVFPDGVAALAASGLPGRYKRSGGANDLYLTELGMALAWWRDAAVERARAAGTDEHDTAIAILADGSTPYRVLVEVLFTAGQAEVNRFEIGARAPDGSLGFTVSRPPRARAAQPAPLGLAVLVVHDGVAIKARGGNIAPGCNGVGAGLAVPKRGDAYDSSALAACLAKIKKELPDAKDDTHVTVTASAAVDLQTLAATLDAVRGTKETGPLFPDVEFGIAK